MYNKHTNAAELYIIDNNYTAALNEYQAAFNTGVTFAQDLYNACVCSSKLNDKQKLIALSTQLAKTGVGSNFFKRNTFKKWLDDSDMAAIIKEADTIRQKFQNTTKQYTQGLRTFFIKDSTYNRLRQTKFASEYELPDTLQNLFKENTKNLLAYLETNGFYNEKRIGAKVVNDTLLGPFTQSDIVILHYLEMGNDTATVSAIKHLLLQQLDNGTVKPYQVEAFIILSHGIFEDIGHWNYQIYQCGLYRANKIEHESAINVSRAKYYMDYLEGFEKKIVFHYSRISDFDIRQYIIKSPVHDVDFFNSAYHNIATLVKCN
ncbi:hypothetical protein AM493_04355 [Flavobacterium akiainvivens]|uniref:Uncharacterized protein n=2 Tax=Flavobacterium akiainvivens TaxID=1202724 RepID=A0A0M8MGL1_9FLAO|nr:hypothetical protein AM493_04355 [Flavobacterium akiainvivens]SFQ76762.1 hypothetical protein SAMN05444144_12425 [Flavobacterium akiainvivens]